jgi:pimeloyl-ACP methyl ester carboxylesterase
MMRTASRTTFRRGGRLSSSTLRRGRALGQIKRVFRIFIAIAAGVALGACTESDRPTVVARDAALRAEPVFLYAAADSTKPPRAVVFFFGNDIGFWQPHRRLASSLAGSQYAVAGFDMRPLLRSLPDRIAERDSAFAARIEPIIAQARHELGGDSVPLIIAGHSLGAEVAIWAAAYVCPPGTVGVLALSPGSRSHLRVSVSDIMNGPEPTGPGSFSVPAAIAAIPPDERVAIIRGTRDDFVKVDPELLAAGGDRIQRWEVLFSGHSLKGLAMARFEVGRALDWLLGDMQARR